MQPGKSEYLSSVLPFPLCRWLHREPDEELGRNTDLETDTSARYSSIISALTVPHYEKKTQLLLCTNEKSNILQTRLYILVADMYPRAEDSGSHPLIPGFPSGYSWGCSGATAQAGAAGWDSESSHYLLSPQPGICRGSRAASCKHTVTKKTPLAVTALAHRKQA